MSGRISCVDVILMWWVPWTTRQVCSDQSEAHHQLDGLNEPEIGLSFAFE